MEAQAMATKTPTSIIVAHAAFAERMAQACDANIDIPQLNDGRLTWIHNQMRRREHEVSLQTVMRWYYGAALPRQNKLISLADSLGVSPSWLSLGRSEVEKIDTSTRRMNPEGAVHALAGHMQLAGIPCAFPERDDPRADTVHFYTIIGGRQHPIHVSAAHLIGDSKNLVVFRVPAKHSKVLIVLVMAVAQKAIEVWHIPEDMIDLHAEKDNDTKVLSAKLVRRNLWFGTYEVRPVEDLTQAILA